MRRTLKPVSRTTASMTSVRRSARRFSAYIGYSTTVPSAWKLTQLFGKTASGLGGRVGVRHHAHADALRGQRRGESVEFAQCPLRDFVGDTAIRVPAC